MSLQEVLDFIDYLHNNVDGGVDVSNEVEVLKNIVRNSYEYK